MRVVFDTNVVVSALLFEHGRLRWLRVVWGARQCTPLMSTATCDELLKVLKYPKFGLASADREELLGEYLPFAETVEVAEGVHAQPAATDPDDQKFLDLAMVGRAGLLVTGDRGLLEGAGSWPFEVLTPAVARARLDPAR